MTDLKLGDPVRTLVFAPDGVRRFWRSARFVRVASLSECADAIVASVDGRTGIYLSHEWKLPSLGPAATNREMPALAVVPAPVESEGLDEEIRAAIADDAADVEILAQGYRSGDRHPHGAYLSGHKDGKRSAVLILGAIASQRERTHGRDERVDFARWCADVIEGKL